MEDRSQYLDGMNHVLPKLFLLQLAGENGVGKSTLAGGIAARTGAVVLDLDVIKSAALDAGAAWELSSRVTHAALRALADSLLGQGFSVILDHPCRFEQIWAEGIAIADRRDAAYCFIDCVLHDKTELGRRIRARSRLRSQMVDYGVSSPDAPPNATRAALIQEQGQAFFDTRTPPTPWLRIDTKVEPERCLESALNYLRERLELPAERSVR